MKSIIFHYVCNFSTRIRKSKLTSNSRRRQRTGISRHPARHCTHHLPDKTTGRKAPHRQCRNPNHERRSQQDDRRMPQTQGRRAPRDPHGQRNVPAATHPRRPRRPSPFPSRNHARGAGHGGKQSVRRPLSKRLAQVINEEILPQQRRFGLENAIAHHTRRIQP